MRSSPGRAEVLAITILGFAVTANLGDQLVATVRVQYVDILWLMSLILLAWTTGFPKLQQAVRASPRSLGVALMTWVLALIVVLIINPSVANGIKFAGYIALTGTFALGYLWSSLPGYGQSLVKPVSFLLVLHVCANVAGGFLGIAGIEGVGSRTFQGSFYLELVRTEGLPQHPNRSSLVTLVLYCLWTMLLIKYRQKLRMYEWIVAFVSPVASLWTLSPMAFLSFPILGVFITRFAPWSPRVIPGALLVGGIAASLAVSFVAPWRGENGDWTLIAAPRTIVQLSTMDSITSAPLAGNGLAHRGATVFSSGYPPRIYNRPTDPHNAYLDLLSTGGLVLLIAYLAWVTAMPGWKRSDTGWRVVVLCWLVSGLMHSTNDERIMYFGFALVAGFAHQHFRREPG